MVRLVIWVVVLASVFAAFPVWREMTRTYVAPLPCASVSQWAQKMANGSHWGCTINIAILAAINEGPLDQDLLSQGKEITLHSSSDPPCIAKALLSEVRVPERVWALVSSPQSPEEMERLLGEVHQPESADYRLFLLPSVSSEAGLPVAYVGQGTLAWIRFAKNKASEEIYQGALLNLMHEVVQTFVGSESLSSIADPKEEAHQQGAKAKEDSPSSVSVAISADYRISFTLINALWSFQTDMLPFLAGFLGEASQLGSISIDSQVISDNALASFLANEELESDGSAHYIPLSKVPGLVNSNDLIPDPTVTAEIAINLILYVPPAHVMPLHIRVDNESWTDGFVIPGQGGVVILNTVTADQNNTSHALDAAQLQLAASLFVQQLRELLGFRSRSSLHKGDSSHPRELVSHNTGVSQWEMETLVRSRTWKMLARAVETLVAICDLAKRQGHLALPDSVGRKMNAAIILLEDACSNASHSQFLTAHKAALLASSEASAAATDADSISLLHYPDEHEIAIYVPHFLPVFWPLFFGLLGEASYFCYQKLRARFARAA